MAAPKPAMPPRAVASTPSHVPPRAAHGEVRPVPLREHEGRAADRRATTRSSSPVRTTEMPPPTLTARQFTSVARMIDRERDRLQHAEGDVVSAEVHGEERPIERAADQAVQEDREARPPSPPAIRCRPRRTASSRRGTRRAGRTPSRMNTYSPPARGIIAASSAYVSAPARLSRPAATHAASTSHGVSTLHIITRVLRKIPCR